MKQRLLVYALVLVVVLGWLAWRGRTPAPIDVIVVRDGVVSADGQIVETAQLGAHVAAQLERDARRRVRVTVDAKAPSTTLIPVLQSLEQSGVENVEVIANP
ncbi:MAG: ExbD/TolR family protein [Sinimarinibacterium flocculans]|mgnify:CR=1 FL=1|uniref:Biopolymer transport protein ExbD/TolR n=1 Tax=Sinimarinibacterium flocculans TaxID=985250 RepID=A0A318EKI1_9GAMM|nr:biopolymer transporter ExbD [Sinimarinibacterium flocculans]MEC9362762.1 biopolymer transporter ExbD [Pseudomonadota bacterium]PXV71412.1 biopolymer transport protein ExbD/TolR [Sinimarinibacterium flocculans]